MDIWEKILTSDWGKEFVAGGFGGTSGVVAGYPLDTLRILQQQQHTGKGSAISILRRVLANEGPFALYKGMAAPLASVAFQVLVLPSFYHSIYVPRSSGPRMEVQWGRNQKTLGPKPKKNLKT